MPLQPSISAENYVQQMYDHNGVPLYANGNAVYEDDDGTQQFPPLYTDGVAVYGGAPGYPGGQPPAGALVPMQDEAGNVYLTEVTYAPGPVEGDGGGSPGGDTPTPFGSGNAAEQGGVHQQQGDTVGVEQQGEGKGEASAAAAAGIPSPVKTATDKNSAASSTPHSNGSTEEISVTVSSLPQGASVGARNGSSGDEETGLLVDDAGDQGSATNKGIQGVNTQSDSDKVIKKHVVLNGAPALPVPPPRGD